MSTGIANLLSLDLGSDPNAINPKSKDVIPVAVLGSVNFDATQVDFSTAEFGPRKASPIHDGHVEDVNNDDFFDVVFPSILRTPVLPVMILKPRCRLRHSAELHLLALNQSRPPVVSDASALT